MRLILVAALSLVIACVAATGSSPPPSRPQPTEPPGPTPTNPSDPAPPPSMDKPDGATCLTGGECASKVCEGQGCEATVPGTCAPAARACTRDLRAYCSCDGKTFRASGSCPNQRYASKGECPGG